MSEATKAIHRPGATARPPAARARALLILGYAAAAYGLFLAASVYTVGFLAGFAVPKDIDDGLRSGWPLAVAIDLGLLALFAVQHTVMARSWFKRWLTRVVPGPAERATFVLGATLTLALLFWAWRPVGGVIWKLSGPAYAVLIAVQFAGWAVAISSTFMISHLDLFGLRQACLHLRGTSYTPPAFTERGLYRRVRHPLMTGFLIVFWAAPAMTAGHLLFAAAATGYILAGIWFEERDLVRSLGPAYASYLATVPALIPDPRRCRS